MSLSQEDITLIKIVSALVMGILGKITWTYLSNLKNPSLEELREELKTQNSIVLLERRLAMLEKDIEAKMSRDAFIAHSEKLELIHQQQADRMSVCSAHQASEFTQIRRQLEELNRRLDRREQTRPSNRKNNT